MQGHRPITVEVNVKKIRQDAQELIDGGSKKFKGDDSIFHSFICERSDSELRGIFNEFDNLFGKSIGKEINFFSPEELFYEI